MTNMRLFAATNCEIDAEQIVASVVVKRNQVLEIVKNKDAKLRFEIYLITRPCRFAQKKKTEN